ncbi:MAG: TolC family protein [Candidatus Cloacimonadaceae bacterium]|jgi:outer membrane protein|nr:TolC family protein [Candidatus Cloacimonadota bacterium]MCB5258538.1 TolC family protein [Candidatus Cloacimonadota bacterium]MDD5625096.1 TolC family protein [Candidatus Cloacimonadota bacterium]MDY0112148.1 TolC family protein [Candidatus Syntrophosphaera sp.]
MKRIIIILSLCLIVSMFWSISLDESISLAKQNNKDLLIAKEDLGKADQTYYQVRANLYPQLNIVGAYNLNKTYLPDSAIVPPVDLSLGLDPNTASSNDYYLANAMSAALNSLVPSSPMEEGSVALALQMQQVLFTGGKLNYGIKTADIYRNIQQLNYQLKEQDIVLKTTQMFYSCLLTDKLVNVQEAALETARQHLTQVEIFADEGLVSEFDVMRARLEVAKLEPLLMQAQNSRDLALSAFRNQIGVNDTTMVPEGDFILPTELDLTLDEAITQGMENRLELEMARKGTEVADLQLKTEKSGYFPNLALQASAALYTKADEYAVEGDDFGTNYSVGLGISFPLFNGFATKAKVNSAKFNYRQSQYQEYKYEDLIRLEITQNYKKLKHAEENYLVQEENMKMAERSLQLAQLRYENQVGIQLEVFDAQTTLSAIQLQYYQAIYEVISATRELQKSIGIIL